MARVKPYSGVSSTRLVNLINQNNLSNLNLGVDYTLGTPVPAAGPNGRNTSIVFAPTNFQVYQPQSIRYKRLSLAVLSNLPVDEILPVAITQVPFTIVGILPAINEALGLDLQASEVYNEQFTTVLPTYRLKIRDNNASLAWVDSEFYFTANHQRAQLLEDGTPRLLEDGSILMLEDPVF